MSGEHLYRHTISAKDMQFYASIGNNAYNYIFSNELIVAICWEESRFSNIRQMKGGPAVGFGQLQKEGLFKANQHKTGLSNPKDYLPFTEATVMGSPPISVSATSHALAGYYDSFKTDRVKNALRAYAGGFVSALNDKIPDRWRACETALKLLPGPADMNPDAFMAALNLSLSPANPNQRLGSSGTLFNFVRAKLFPQLAVQKLDYQTEWRWCNKCSGVWFGGGGSGRAGVCPKGGTHNSAGSGNYRLTAGDGPGQPGWRWCYKCEGLWFAGDGSPNKCPAGYTHSDSNSGKYLGGLNTGKGQGGWKYCWQCGGMFLSNAANGGFCPGTKKAHDGSQSGNYWFEGV